MSLQVNFNGGFYDEQEVSISVNNRSFRYGDGCFETIKVIDGKIILAALHFTRLFSSLDILQFQVPPAFNAEYLKQLILQVTERNDHSTHARVRLMVFRGNGGLFDEIDHEPNFIIQSWKGNEETNRFNADGLTLNIFRDAKKTADNFSGIKSNNYLTYIMGALHAKKNTADDAIILNPFNRVAEATIANIFIVMNGTIKTPPLTEGCVSGVMRKHLISCFKKANLSFAEKEIEMEQLLAATEVFLTNAMYGIRWVRKIGNSEYTNQLSSFLHQEYIAPLFASTF